MLTIAITLSAGAFLGALLLWAMLAPRHAQILAEEQAKFKVLQAELLREKSLVQEKVVLLETAQRTFENTFKALSADALRQSSDSFLQLAKQQFEQLQQQARGDLEKKQTAIDQLVKPVRETLDKFDQKLLDLEKGRVVAYEGLTQQVRSLMETQSVLKSETANLVKALRAPQVRGRWGEIQLRRVVEMAGMLNYCDFVEQVSTDTETGRLRPDVIVRLPGGKNIVIDAETTLHSYLEAIQVTDETKRLELMRQHAQQIRDRISELGTKKYWEQFSPSPEFVFLFLPGEAFYSAALESDPSLIEIGVEQGVLIATPTTLIALLKAVAYGWSQEQLTEQAEQVRKFGRDLHERLGTFLSSFVAIGRNLKGALDQYNRAIGSYETRLAPAARRLGELEALGQLEPHEELAPVEVEPRLLKSDLSAAIVADKDTISGN